MENQRRRRLGDGGHAEADGGSRRGSCCGFLGSSKCEKGAGIGSRGSEEELGSLFVEAGAQGTSPRRHGTWAWRQFRLDRRGRGTRGRRETVPTGGPGLAAAEGGAKGARQRLLAHGAGPRGTGPVRRERRKKWEEGKEGARGWVGGLGQQAKLREGRE